MLKSNLCLLTCSYNIIHYTSMVIIVALDDSTVRRLLLTASSGSPLYVSACLRNPWHFSIFLILNTDCFLLHIFFPPISVCFSAFFDTVSVLHSQFFFISFTGYLIMRFLMDSKVLLPTFAAQKDPPSEFLVQHDSI